MRNESASGNSNSTFTARELTFFINFKLIYFNSQKRVDSIVALSSSLHLSSLRNYEASEIYDAIET